LDPVPENWSDGQQLRVQADELTANGSESDAWSREMAVLTAELDDPVAWKQLDGYLREADEQAKAWVRREMGLQ